MATLSSPTLSANVLGKRKADVRHESSLVLHLEPLNPSTSFYIPVNTGPAPDPKRPYACSFDGCAKTYKKPSRLAEHERSHTGVRPYVCTTCSRTYLRETHLQAHARSHQPNSARQFVCPEAGCQKRFWTAQHLRVHGETHSGEKPFKCPEDGCDETFAKHHQLRAHACAAHAPPGTKAYICPRADCPKSFSTNQKLVAHGKVHEEKRYTCVHPACLPHGGGVTAAPVYFPTWSALQRHARTAHPPACPYVSCAGRTFTQQKGLRAHLKLHEQREAEAAIECVVDASEEEHADINRPRKRRRGGEFGRDWKCDVPGCDKDFKSKKALATHHNVSHLGRRGYICPRENCQRAFGYKHLLQRHMVKVHYISSGDEAEGGTVNEMTTGGETAEETDDDRDAGVPASAIDDLTGKAYSLRLRSSKSLECPYPDLGGLADTDAAGHSTSAHRSACAYVFSRPYDLRRHLKAEHGVLVDKKRVELWVESWKSPSAP